MIFTTKSGETFDTNQDLTAPERHILQKLFLWETLASSVEEFRSKKADAFCNGWNNSGPVEESQAMKIIIRDLEERVALRLEES